MGKFQFLLLATSVVVLQHAPLFAQQPVSIAALVSAKSQAELSARRTGVLAEILPNLGDQVEQGVLLLRFDCKLEAARIAAAQAEVQAAQQEVNLQSALQKRGASGTALVERARAALNNTKAQLAIAQTEAQDCEISAPFSGVVAEIAARPYETVSAGAPLLTVLDPNSVRLEVIIPANWIKSIRVGDTLSFQADATEEIYQARISHLAPFIEPASQTITVQADFEENATVPRSGSAGVATFENISHD